MFSSLSIWIISYFYTNSLVLDKIRPKSDYLLFIYLNSFINILDSRLKIWIQAQKYLKIYMSGFIGTIYLSGQIDKYGRGREFHIYIF